ncbi:hypothetical protein VNO77_08209 [Canavalia gladiata]|uniref:Uncharacterized protein n=1 Tax=Canavalia gladiata TaxID=3824 RepID=A0AAN9MDW5_CANGL
MKGTNKCFANVQGFSSGNRFCTKSKSRVYYEVGAYVPATELAVHVVDYHHKRLQEMCLVQDGEVWTSSGVEHANVRSAWTSYQCWQGFRSGNVITRAWLISRERSWTSFLISVEKIPIFVNYHSMRVDMVSNYS